MRELWCVNTSDNIADGLVVQYFTYQQEVENWSKLSPALQFISPYPSAPVPLHDDSSTGLGQIFARTAIAANNSAIDRGIINGTKYDSNNWKNRKTVWELLRYNDHYNMDTIALILIYEAKNIGLSTNYWNYSDSQVKSLLAKYNGSGSAAAQYGNECFNYYTIFKSYNS